MGCYDIPIVNEPPSWSRLDNMICRRNFCAGLGSAVLLGGCSTGGMASKRDLPDASPPEQMTLTSHGSGKSKVIEVRWSRAVDLQGRVDGSAVQRMLSAAMGALMNSATPWVEWAGGKRRIGIKVNTITSQAYTHPEVGAAIAGGLVGAGSDPARITVWDRDTFGLKDRGYNVDAQGKGQFRCLGSDMAGGAGKVKRATVAGHSVSLSSLLTEADVIINAAALKDHSMAGVSLSLKNNFGMIQSALMLHGNVQKGSGCEPGISQLAALDQIKGRTQLVLLDGLVGVCHGGPGPAEQQHAFRYGGLLVSRDPVAIDRRGLSIIDQRRAKLGMEPVGQRTTPNPSPAIHIDNAAALGVGTG